MTDPFTPPRKRRAALPRDDRSGRIEEKSPANDPFLFGYAADLDQALRVVLGALEALQGGLEPGSRESVVNQACAAYLHALQGVVQPHTVLDAHAMAPEKWPRMPWNKGD